MSVRLYSQFVDNFVDNFVENQGYSVIFYGAIGAIKNRSNEHICYVLLLGLFVYRLRGCLFYTAEV